MNAVRAEAARRAEVRSAARAWRAGGAIDEKALVGIESAYPEDHPRMSVAWRAVVFTIVTVAANALFFAYAEIVRREPGAAPWLLFAVLLSAATELLLGRTRLGENGSAAATSFWAVVYAVVGAVMAGDGARDWEPTVTTALLAATVLFAAGCWRWGFAAYGAFSAIALFLLLARFPHGRLAWLALGTVLAAVAPRLQDRRSLAPPHRRAAAGVFLAAAAAVYAAVNRWSLDQRVVESLRQDSHGRTGTDPTVVVLSWIATALFPSLLILWGLRARRTLVLDTGLVLAALSLVTLRFYVHLAPLWVVLAGSGGALVLLALGLHRWLRRAPGEERRGFTVRELYDERRTSLETAAVVAAFAPDASPARPREPGGFEPGGGRYGGGGAEGSF
jgi:MFS family permease